MEEETHPAFDIAPPAKEVTALTPPQAADKKASGTAKTKLKITRAEDRPFGRL